MKYLMNSAQMKACDAWTIQTMQVPAMVLMERAALAVQEEINREGFDIGRILVVCGSGNNGGDGFAAARLFLLAGADCTVWFVGEEAKLTKETALQKKIFENYGGKVCRNAAPHEYTLIVDALFGIGLSRAVEGVCAQAVTQINDSDRPVVSIDIPSGISADSGKIMGTAIQADLTITFAFQKLGQVLYPGASCCGKTIVRDIGILQNGAFTAVAYEDADLCRLPHRAAYSNKGSYGKVLLIGGSRNMAGSILLSARAAYRSGCGLVKVLAPECNRLILQQGIPEALFAPWEETELTQALLWADVVGIGPGLGTSPEAEALLKQVLSTFHGSIVLDADALNLLARQSASGLSPTSGSEGAEESADWFKNASGQWIVTPHPGEMARLLQNQTGTVLQNVPKTAIEYAREHQVVCVLKDARTAVSDGRQLYLNCSGNHGMAVGGSGDVLTGIICGLCAQGMKPYEAACLGVYLHGRAGDIAGQTRGLRSMIAGDLLEGLSKLLRQAELLDSE